MSTVRPCLAGPKRPRDHLVLRELKESFHETMRQTFALKTESGIELSTDPAYQRWLEEGGGVQEGGAEPELKPLEERGATRRYLENAFKVTHSSVVIAAITSCTNTSNPALLFAARLLAKKAVERDLRVKPYVKTSLSPVSRVVTDYLRAAGLLPYLKALGFHLVGYGCTICIGNSGLLPRYVAQEVEERDLTVAAVLSGN